jgi:hypothetical protein
MDDIFSTSESNGPPIPTYSTLTADFLTFLQIRLNGQ